jgi:tRNA pseudouridine38-40 synthase
MRNMVRKMVGTLLEVGRGKNAASDIPALLALRDRTKSGATAPPHGLCLESVEYSQSEKIARPSHPN